MNATVRPRPRRPRPVTTALGHLREARLELIAAGRITEAAELAEFIRRVERGS